MFVYIVNDDLFQIYRACSRRVWRSYFVGQMHKLWLGEELYELSVEAEAVICIDVDSLPTKTRKSKGKFEKKK